MTGRKALRRAGSSWRILVHEPKGDSHECSSTSLPGTEFDEIVVGKWIHLEQMDTGSWWMNIGGVTIWVKADRDGKPESVSVYGPGDYADPVEGCVYGLTWAAEGADPAPCRCSAGRNTGSSEGLMAAACIAVIPGCPDCQLPYNLSHPGGCDDICRFAASAFVNEPEAHAAFHAAQRRDGSIQ